MISYLKIISLTTNLPGETYMKTLLISALTMVSLTAYTHAGPVNQAQALLNDLGFDAGTVDGVYGRKTEQALIEYYASLGLAYDGLLDQNEINDLRKSISGVDISIPLAASVEENPRCGKPYYDNRPEPVSSDETYRYYDFYWQQNPDLCIHFRQRELLEPELINTVERGLNFASQNLGLIVPLNAMIVDQQNADRETLRQISEDNCILRGQGGDQLQSCIFYDDDWGRRFAAAGVDFHHFYNGGDLSYFRDTWLDTNGPIRILMHEFYHVYQNSMKFYFEDKQLFGVRIQIEDDPERYLWADDRVTVFPNWIEEGGAEFAAFALTAKFDPSINIRSQMIEFLDEARGVVNTAANNGDRVSLKDYEYQASLYEFEDNPNNGIPRNYAYAYTGGFMGLVYLWSLDDDNFKKIVVDYYKIYAERDQQNPGQGWKVAFEELFGMTMDDFYSQFDEFMLKSRDEQLAVLRSSEAWRMASLD